MRSRFFRWAGTITVLVVGLSVVWIVLEVGGEHATMVFSDLVNTAVPLAAAAACFVAVRRSEHQRERWGWMLLGAAVASWGLGNAAWTWFELVKGTEVPFPSVADVGYLGMIPLATAGVAALSPIRRASLARQALDGCILAGSLLFVSWVLVLADAQAGATGSLVAQVVLLAYPLGDVIILAVVLLAISRAERGVRGPFMLVGAGIVAVSLADSGFLYLVQHDAYASGNPIDAGWIAGFALVGLGAVRRAVARDGALAGDVRVPGRAAMALPTTAVLAGVAFAMFEQVSLGSLTPFLFWNAVAVIILVLARNAVSVMEVSSLPRHLETKVRERTAELREREQELAHRAFHDSLTGLPNRALFIDRVEQAIARAARRATPVTVLYLDLDGFKGVNDTFGHAVGDRLIRAVAERLASLVRSADTVARFGGDEFAVLLDDGTEPGEASALASRILASFEAPFAVEGRDLVVGASIGIAATETGLEDAGDLLRNADVAMYHAKSEGRGRHEQFDPEMHAVVRERLELEADLRIALERGELFLEYQPIVDLETERVTGVEALVRWRHPVRGLLPPADFIHLAEESGLIVPIGAWVLGEANRQLREWRDRLGSAAPDTVSVNVSARQFRDADLVDHVAAVLASSMIEPEALVLEITESFLMDDPEGAIAKLEAIKELGVMIAIDDFGMGYSSLSYLQRFPIDVLKVDRIFVQALGGSPEDAALAQAIVKLARTFRLRTVGEGIETPEQADALREMGCDCGQGYLFSRPIPPSDLEQMLHPPALYGAARAPASSGGARASVTIPFAAA